MMDSQQLGKSSIPSFRRRPEVREQSETPIQSFRSIAARLDPGLRRGDELLQFRQFLGKQKTIGAAAKI